MLAVAAALAASTAFAHGPQIQITNDNNKIVTRRIVADEPYTTLTAPTLLYVIPLHPFNGVWYARPNNAYPTGAGLAYGYDQVDGGVRAFEAGTHFELNFADSLTRWNGAAFVDPGSEQIGAFRGSSTVSLDQAITSDSGPVPGIVFPNTSATYNANAHSGARFRLLGNGADPLSSSQDGVYLLKLQITSNQSNLESSDVFSFLLHKNAAPEEIASAVRFLELDSSLVQYVPEPGASALVALGSLCCLGWRHMKRRGALEN
jgi:hypothetical protein